MVTVLNRLTLRKMYCCVSLIAMFCTSCNCGAVELASNGQSNNAVKSDDTLYYLDIRKPSVTQPVELKSGEQEAYKFVQVEVTDVINPKKHPLTFEVRYQVGGNAKMYLGSFSLLPCRQPW